MNKNKLIIDKEELLFFNNKSVLITGAGGMLGSAFDKLLRNFVPSCNLISFTHSQLDVTDASAVSAIANTNPPDVIIHCAANVNADNCEQNPEQCFNVQVSGTNNISALAKLSNARVLYPQSFLIFGENELPVNENTPPSPLSVYGKCKFEAEQLLLKNHSDALVIRMGGFFGGEALDKNFVGKFVPHLASLIKKGQVQQEVGGRVWQPTYTIDLAYNSLVLLANNKYGIYNMASHGEASFYDLAKEITGYLNIADKIEIIPAAIDTIKKIDIAKRPTKLIMQNQRLQNEKLDLQRNWKESLYDYLSNPYFKKLFL